MKYVTCTLRLRPVLMACGVLLPATACTRTHPIAESRYVEPDRLYHTLETNVHANPAFDVIAGIDHSRLAAEAGSSMPPSRVLIWSDPELEAAMLQHNPLAAIDLPLRALAYEDQRTGQAAVIANGYDYVAHRYSLPEDEGLRSRYESDVAEAVNGIAPDAIATFPSDTMTDAGLVTLESTHDFAATEKRILDAIDAQSDAVIFGTVDFSARARAYGVVLRPIVLILFGAPGPGGRAMEAAPTLGLDAFCQKLLIWQDDDGAVYVTFNDLLALAKRHQVSARVPLRLINRRLKKTFTDALEQ